MQKMCAETVRRYPNNNMIWYPMIQMISSDFMFRFYHFFYHIVPGFFFDIILRIQKSKMRLAPIYTKIYTQLMLVSYFMKTTWSFSDHNKFELFRWMTKEDHSEFPCHTSLQDYKDVYMIGGAAITKYHFKQTDEDDLKAKKKLKIFFVLHYAFLALFYSICAFCLYQVIYNFL